jgi:hypothetical protein
MLDLLRAAPVSTIDEVLSIMMAIDNRLPDSDGLKWFNRLYLQVTRNVREAVAGPTFRDVLWTLRPTPHIRTAFFDTLDRSTGLAGRGLLTPIGLDLVSTGSRRSLGGGG